MSALTVLTFNTADSATMIQLQWSHTHTHTHTHTLFWLFVSESQNLPRLFVCLHRCVCLSVCGLILSGSQKKICVTWRLSCLCLWACERLMEFGVFYVCVSVRNSWWWRSWKLWTCQQRMPTASPTRTWRSTYCQTGRRNSRLRWLPLQLPAPTPVSTDRKVFGLNI